MTSISQVIERRPWWVVLAGGITAVLLLAGCGARNSPEAPPGPSGPAGAATPAVPANCTHRVNDSNSLQQALAGASGGDTICVSGDLGDTRLKVSKGGSDGSPLSIVGDGRTAVKGITVEADNVVIDGFTAEQPKAPGVSLLGNNITLQNTTIDEPQKDDNDGIRFWGGNIRIVHNTISNTRNTKGSHADCMQTFATDEDSPASHDILIDSNRCEKIDNNCIIAEGPNSAAGDGSGEGESTNLTFSNNYCENKASQAVMIDDVQHVTVTGNEIAGRINHAFAFQNQATGAIVKDNRIASGVKFEVGMDDTSEKNYQGPEVGGAP